MIGKRRGRALLIGAAVLTVLLVAGRWLAVETAERAWASSLSGGAVYLDGRGLARLARLSVWLIATLWGTGNLYIVYRAIGSVQMPRRVGNLEIVEAVPQQLLLALAVGTGLVFGIGLAWGTGDWWREALLSGAAPRFGRADPILNRDLGYYLAELPWAIERQRFLLLATVTAGVLVAFLYFGIGSLRWQRGRVIASPHARAHVGVLLAGIAVAELWGALLDPAEVVAGLHGTVDGGVMAVRLPGAAAVAAAAGVAVVASLAWAGWDRPRWLTAAWGLLLITMMGVYAILPAAARRAAGEPLFARERGELRDLAFGTARRALPAAPEFASVERFVAAVPLWSPDRVAAATRARLGPHETVAGVGLARTPDGAPVWIAALAPNDSALAAQQPAPNWELVHHGVRAASGGPLGLAEADTGLVSVPLDVRDSRTWFGEGFTQYAVRPASLGAGAGGIPLERGWRRIALAWVLQSPEIARSTAPGDRLLWRRTASERLALLAPFAEFDAPRPVIADGALWWLATGYVTARTFPLIEPGPVRFRRAGLAGAVRATTGETRLWKLPGADSLTATWARLFEPLVAPADSLPPALAAALPFPEATFTLAVEQVLKAAPDSDHWRSTARAPYDLPAPGGGPTWLAQGFTSGETPRFEGFLVGRFGAAGPELLYLPPPALDPPPKLLVGAADTVPGPLRLWFAEGHLVSSQARFVAPPKEAPRLERVYLSWGNRTGEGSTAAAALHDLTIAGPPGPADTSLVARWAQARRLFAQLDSALQARDFERFGRVYRQLNEVFGAARRRLAPVAPRQ